MNASRLAAWLRRKASTEATRLELVWDSLDGMQTVEVWSREDIATLGAERVIDSAQEHCDGLRTPARYVVRWVTDTGRVVASFPARCEPRVDDDEEEEGPEDVLRGKARTEEPTLTGMLGQFMRHLEVDKRLTTAATSSSLMAQRDIIRDLRQELQSQRDENRVLRQRMRSMQREMDESQGADVDAAVRSESWERVVSLVEQHAPALLQAYVAQRANGSGGGH